MKRNVLYFALILSMLTLSACGGSATPTVNVESVQQTAVADALATAWVGMTQTQAAAPTATSTLPPTAIPTLVVPQLFPTLPVLQPTAPPSNPTLNPCNDVPPAKPLGTTVQARFINKSEGLVNLSFGMTAPNGKGECGTYGYTLARFDEVQVTVLAGCYWGYAWISDRPDPKKRTSTASTPDVLCLNDTSKAVAIWITAEVINFH